MTTVHQPSVKTPQWLAASLRGTPAATLLGELEREGDAWFLSRSSLPALREFAAHTEAACAAILQASAP
jgi:hypothetical protein